jgi:AcrR family transcriptional regulator
LNFTDKEALFEAIVRSVMSPVIATIRAVDFSAITCVREAIEQFALPPIRELATSRRADVIRLLIAEGPRFPRLAEFYYSEVIEPGLTQLRLLLHRAVQTGEIADQRMAGFPQLLAAPVLTAILWQGLFQRFDPLDVEAMLKTYLDIYFGPRAGMEPGANPAQPMGGIVPFESRAGALPPSGGRLGAESFVLSKPQ